MPTVINTGRVCPHIEPTTSTITAADRWDHVLARWGVNRSGHRVEPGLYSLGCPTANSLVFVTANYTLSFDALRSALVGVESYILVLDTQGVNVWCAAGKGTFGTDELVHRIEVTALHDVVSRRVLILPQLGAAGIAAHEVKTRSGFKVEYGPVRAADLPEYLQTGQATREMRRVRFSLLDRLVLIPVELVHFLPALMIAAVALFFVGGVPACLAAVSAILAGVVLFPLLLPWVPTRSFSSQGLILGALVALPFALAVLRHNPGTTLWQRIGEALAYLLSMPPVTAFLALNFTGSSTFTSKSGVRREMYTYIPIMASMFGLGIVLTIVLLLI
jgi:hypothetical protein